MTPFDPLTGAALLIMAAGTETLCQMPKATQINVTPMTKDVKFDYSQSFAALQQKQVDTINPYGYNSVTHTNGYMDGEILTRSSVKLDYKFLPQHNAYCIWYETVNVEIEIDPTIVIAKEVADDLCMRGAVKEHEMKHVNVDRRIVNKYAQSIGRKVYDGLKQRGFLAGPIPAEHAQATADRMKETVGQLMEIEQKKLEIERAESQQAVDSLEEYNSVSAECPHFKSPAAKAAAKAAAAAARSQARSGAQ